MIHASRALRGACIVFSFVALACGGGSDTATGAGGNGGNGAGSTGTPGSGAASGTGTLAGGGGASGTATMGTSMTTLTGSGAGMSTNATTTGTLSTSAGNGGSGAGVGVGGAGGADACETCLDTATTGACKTQNDACTASMPCTKLENCIGNCTTNACEQQCAQASPNGITPFNALVTCLQGECSTICGGGAGGGGVGGGAAGGGGSGAGGGVVTQACASAFPAGATHGDALNACLATNNCAQTCAGTGGGGAGAGAGGAGAGAGGSTGAGASGGGGAGGGSCSAAPVHFQDPCFDKCADDDCCAPLTACDADCQSYYSCILEGGPSFPICNSGATIEPQACATCLGMGTPTTGCCGAVTACVNDTKCNACLTGTGACPMGNAKIAAAITCLETTCSSECM